MTEKEAVDRLVKSAYRTTCYGNKVVEHEENLVAIQALEKQIQKPIDRQYDEATGWCPVCGSYLSKTWNRHYCGNCGQRLE